MNPCRRELVDVVEISDEEYVKRWLKKEYKGKEIGEEEKEIHIKTNHL